MTKSEAIAALDVKALVYVLRQELFENSGSIPTSLREKKAWLCYEVTKINPKTGKFNKIPVYPVTGKNRFGEQGSVEDLKNLGTYDQAIKALKSNKNLAGIGFATLENFGVVALDVDHSVKDGIVREDVFDLTNETYVELSPSGTGVRAFWHGEANDGKNHDTGFELFHSTGFVTVTGNVIHNLHYVIELPFPLLDKSTKATLEKLVKSRPTMLKFEDQLGDEHNFENGLLPSEETIIHLKDALNHLNADDYDVWIDVGMALKTIGDIGRVLWMEWSATSEKFDDLENTRTWDNLKPSRTHYKAIFNKAKEEGWINPLSNSKYVSFVTTKGDSFKYYTADEIISSDPMSWLIKGVLPSSGLGVIYGESGSGKTFITLDLAIHIARGEYWHGRKTRQTGVLYLAAEGGAGLSKRLNAYKKHHTLDKIPSFVVVPEAANLLKDGHTRLIATCQEASNDLSCAIGLIIIDTLNRSMPGGDENSSIDMGTVVAHAGELSKAVGASVLIVHHSGKDQSKGARGHSSLRAAMDTELEVKRDGQIRKLKLTKARDGEDGIEFANRLTVVDLGLDEDLDPITSCVAEPGDMTQAASKQPKPQGKWQEAVIEILNDSNFLKDRSEGLSKSELIANLHKKFESELTGKTRINETIQTSLKKLEEKGILKIDGEILYLSERYT